MGDASIPRAQSQAYKQGQNEDHDRKLLKSFHWIGGRLL
jgi:hypothetical protein